jgi:hypothetical protein
MCLKRPSADTGPRGSLSRFMGKLRSHTARSDGDRERAAQILSTARRMTSVEALAWCDKSERYATSSGLRSESAYFWDSARGWIDAQLDIASMEKRRPRPSSRQAV